MAWKPTAVLRSVVTALLLLSACMTGPAAIDENAPPDEGTPVIAGLTASVAVTSAGFSPRTADVDQGGTVTWTFQQGGHSVVDKSGMGLFNSGVRPGGSTFSAGFASAGSYKYSCTQHRETGTVRVPLSAAPASGTTATTFTVKWSAASAPSGFVFDVQIKRPGSTSYASWKTAQTAASATFLPDAGAGMYAFRSRLRRTADNRAAGYSPAASISVATGGSGGGGGGGGGTEPPALPDRSVFPADNPWNRDVSSDPVDPNSAALIASCGATAALHPDFGTVWDGAPWGIPYITVRGTQARVPVSFYYADESDPGPYPIPPNAPIEGGASATGDRHVLVVDVDNWRLYELFDAHPVNGGASWTAGSGAIFDLASNALRPAGWTSADAAGLPIFPGLVRYDEAVTKGVITHALRFTCPVTRRAYVDPARHFASSRTDANLPPMGMRVRLKANVDISGFPPEVRVILTALKTHGMFLADNGGAFFVSGAPDARWNDANIDTMKRLHGSDFEVVQMGTIHQ
jgi:plastocyanin